MASSERPVGTRFQVICFALQGNDVEFSWEKDGVPIRDTRVKIRTEDSTSILRIDELQQKDVGKYSCVAKNSASTARASSKLVVISEFK